MLVISTVNTSEKKNAGPKAPNDINYILKKKYNAKVIKIYKDKFFKIHTLLFFLKCVFYRGTIVIQHPVIYNYRLLNLLPKNRTIFLIHDLSGLRNQDDKLLSKEVKILKKFNYIIVHNEAMKRFLEKEGVNSQNIIKLEVFDYLANGNIKEGHELKNNIQIIYPGNLKKEKSPFIYQLEEKKMNFQLNLYGIGIENDINKKIVYKGAFEPDEISALVGDIGLIWDGNFDESDEKQTFKNYTKYNNPHKLSCCLAMGIPVIVWEKSAIAEFVKKENIGYLINNIYDINCLKFEDYDIKRKNAIKIGEKLRKGYFTINAFEKIFESKTGLGEKK